VAVVEHACSGAPSSALRPAETDRRHQHPAQTTRAQRFATHRLKLLTELSTVLARLVRAKAGHALAQSIARAASAARLAQRSSAMVKARTRVFLRIEDGVISSTSCSLFRRVPTWCLPRGMILSFICLSSAFAFSRRPSFADPN